MRVLEVTHYKLNPWQSRVTGVVTSEDPAELMPKQPIISIEFTHSEFAQIFLASKGQGKISAELTDALTQAGRDAGLVVDEDEELPPRFTT